MIYPLVILLYMFASSTGSSWILYCLCLVKFPVEMAFLQLRRFYQEVIKPIPFIILLFFHPTHSDHYSFIAMWWTAAFLRADLAPWRAGGIQEVGGVTEVWAGMFVESLDSLSVKVALLKQISHQHQFRSLTHLEIWHNYFGWLAGWRGHTSYRRPGPQLAPVMHADISFQPLAGRENTAATLTLTGIILCFSWVLLDLRVMN